MIKESEANKVQNSEDCTVLEYEGLPTEKFSYAIAEIDGRYPDEKKVTNLECEEIYHVLEGEGVIHSEKGNFELEKGDLYFFEKGEEYWVQGDNLELVLVNAPKWTPDQHEIVE